MQSLLASGHDPDFAMVLAELDAKTRERLAKAIGLDRARTLKLGFHSVGDGTIRVSGDWDQIPTHLRTELEDIISSGFRIQM